MSIVNALDGQEHTHARNTSDAMMLAKIWFVSKDKVPYHLNGVTKRHGEQNGPADLAAMSTYETVVAARNELGPEWEIGFATGPDGSGQYWQAIDFDKIDDNGLGELATKQPGHVEYSRSKRGTHSYGYGRRFPKLTSNESGIEAYSDGQFMVVTTNTIRDSPLVDLASFVEGALVPLHGFYEKKKSRSAVSGNVDDGVIADLKSAIAKIPANCTHDDWVRIGSACKSLGEQGRALFLDWSHTVTFANPKISPEEKWDQLRADRTSYKVIFVEAALHGWQNPAKGWGLAGHSVDTTALFATPNSSENPWPEAEAVSQTSWNSARLTPDCVIESLIFADVGTWNAAGGSSKTTFLLNMFIHVRLGIPFCGRRINKPGRVVFVTAEDSKEIATARLREMASHLFPFGGACDLAERQEKIDAIRDGVRIIDVSHMPVKLATIDGNVVRAHQINVNWLIERIASLEPVLVVFDPTVSFGVGEGHTNDAEQALIEAARMVVRRLNCAFLFVHHTGKENARSKTDDQYSGRGGSALPDGSRMVFVMTPVKPEEWPKIGSELEYDEVAIKISIPKLSYVKPQPPIYVVRKDFSFRHVVPVEPSSIEGVLDFVKAEWKEGRKHSKKTLEKLTKQFRISRDKIRTAIDRLIADELLKSEKGDGNAHWLEPVSVADDARDTEADDA